MKKAKVIYETKAADMNIWKKEMHIHKYINLLKGCKAYIFKGVET